MSYILSSQPWWINLIFWTGRLGLAASILSLVIPLGMTLWIIGSGGHPADKPAWASGYNPVWIALWFLQIMILSFLTVTLYRGLKSLPVLFKDRYIEAFSFEAAALWSLIPLGLFLLPLQLTFTDVLVLPDWAKSIYQIAGLFVKYFG